MKRDTYGPAVDLWALEYHFIAFCVARTHLIRMKKVYMRIYRVLWLVTSIKMIRYGKVNYRTNRKILSQNY